MKARRSSPGASGAIFSGSRITLWKPCISAPGRRKSTPRSLQRTRWSPSAVVVPAPVAQTIPPGAAQATPSPSRHSPARTRRVSFTLASLSLCRWGVRAIPRLRRELEHALDRAQRGLPHRLRHGHLGPQVAQGEVELLERVEPHEGALVAGAALVAAGRLDQRLAGRELLD